MKWTASVSELPMQKFAGIVNTVILILTFALAVFFGIFRVPFLVYFSIPTALVYIICYYLIHRDLLDAYILLVYFWLTLYMCVTTICLGFEYGFHLYCFSMRKAGANDASSSAAAVIQLIAAVRALRDCGEDARIIGEVVPGEERVTLV